MTETCVTPMVQFEFDYTHVDNLPANANWPFPRWSCLLSGMDDRRTMRQQGYYLHKVQRVTLCRACQGIGRVQRTRRGKLLPYTFDTCKACKGRPELSRVTVTYGDIDTE